MASSTEAERASKRARVHTGTEPAAPSLATLDRGHGRGSAAESASGSGPRGLGVAFVVLSPHPTSLVFVRTVQGWRRVCLGGCAAVPL